jgi:hypothetical protein
MRNLKYLFAFIGTLSVILSSCYVIEGPFTEEAVVGECLEKCKKILLEDYTGHKCGNCPRASEKVEELKNIYGEQLITIAIHAGSFAEPSGSYFTSDFRTNTGNEWDRHFGISAAGNPKGMINRSGYPESNHILDFEQWTQEVDKHLQNKPEAYIDLDVNYHSTTRSLEIFSTTEILQSTSDALSLNMILTENSIIAYQKNYDADPEKIPDYEHNHMMRKSLTGTWGTDLGQKYYDKDDLIKKSFHVILDLEWIPENMSVVAFISKTNTFELIQAQETPIK